MAITVLVTPAPAAITDLAGALIAGGSLTVGKSYYYTAVAYRNDTSAIALARQGAYSGQGNEIGPFTPTTGNQQVTLTFTVPAGATAVIIHRRESTWPDYRFSRSVRILNPSLDNATCTSSPFTDTGALGMYYIETASMMVAGTPLLPCGFDPITNGAIAVEWYGGTTGVPITFADIYNALVASYPNYVYWDGNTFGIMGNLYTHTSNECHFKALGSVAYIFGRWDSSVNTHASTALIFGTLYLGKSIDYNTLYTVSAGWRQLMGWRGDKETHYGTKFNYKLQSDVVWIRNGIANFGANCNLIEVEEVSVVNATYIGFNASLFSKKFKSYVNQAWFYVDHKFLLCQEWGAGSVYCYYSDMPRLDRFELIQNTSICDWYDAAPGKSLWALDMVYPNINRADGFPEIYWRSNVPVSNQWREAVSVVLRVVDQTGTAITGGALTIKNKDATPVLDYDGATSINGITSDNNGWFWREQVTVTSATASTVTDSSKSWTTDQWKGRNFAYYKYGRLLGAKVKSNTATVLTLCENLAVSPAAGDKGGIQLEFSWGWLNHKSGTGAGSGAAYTDYNSMNPHTLTITKDGYQDYQDTITVNRKMDMEVALSYVRNSPTNPGLVPLGVKQVAT